MAVVHVVEASDCAGPNASPDGCHILSLRDWPGTTPSPTNPADQSQAETGREGGGRQGAVRCGADAWRCALLRCAGRICLVLGCQKPAGRTAPPTGLAASAPPRVSRMDDTDESVLSGQYCARATALQPNCLTSSVPTLPNDLVAALGLSSHSQ
jgi:hypothetical protein